MLFTNNAGSSLLHHIAQSYSDIESLQFADLIRDNSYRRKLRKYRFQEEVLRDLREERQIKEFLSSYDPFIDHYCFDEPIQTAKDGYFKATLCQAAKARTVEGVIFAEGVLNHWDEEANVRTNSPITLGQIRGRDDWFVDFIHPDEDSEYVKILYIAVSKEHQGSFRRCKEAVKAAYELLLHSGKQILLGTVITKQQAKYPFRNAAYADKMLAPITGSRNRLMRLYERLGFIPVGDNEIVLVTPKAYSTYLSNIDDLMPTKPHLEKHSPYGENERAEMMGML
ncbi:hypothetical protein OAE99_00470 [bacterium]|nr:hypothetical protein [bacterium]MDC0308892.1 hypothetical protein [bacterium]